MLSSGSEVARILVVGADDRKVPDFEAAAEPPLAQPVRDSGGSGVGWGGGVGRGILVLSCFL